MASCLPPQVRVTQIVSSFRREMLLAAPFLSGSILPLPMEQVHTEAEAEPSGDPHLAEAAVMEPAACATSI